MAEGRVLVAAIGNVFLGDDGLGPEVARRLAAVGVPAGVTLVDYGIRGLDLAFALLDHWEAVILVDAVARGDPPGSVTLLEADLDGPAPAGASGGLSGHQITPAAVFGLVRAMGSRPPRVLLVGCEPESFGPPELGRMGLSAAVEAAVPAAVETVLETARTLLGVTA